MNKKINCLHIVYSDLGGASNVVFSLIDSQLTKSTKQQILFYGPQLLNNYKKFCLNKKISFNFIKKQKFFKNVKSIYFFYKKIKFYNPKIIFIHDFSIISCLIYKLFNPSVKIVFVNHTPLASSNFWKVKIIRNFLILFDAWISINKIDFYYMKSMHKTFLKKFFYIENGVNINFFSNQKIKKKEKVFKIGMACRIDNTKEYKLIARALKHSKIKNLNIKFSLCGSGSDLANFKKFLLDEKLTNRVILEGNLFDEKLKNWFRSLDLYVQASKGEQMSISVLQAMSMRVPVIGSNVNGLDNFLNNKKKIGRLFKNNIQDLASSIFFFYKISFAEKKNILFLSTKKFAIIIHII